MQKTFIHNDLAIQLISFFTSFSTQREIKGMIHGKLETHPTLMLEFREGSEAAFDRIFYSLYSPLCLFAFKILHDKHLSEDLVQETFVKIWNKRHQFDNFAKLKSYLYLSLRNACFDHLDTCKVKQKHQDSLSVREEPEQNTVLQEIIRAEVVNRIFSSVDTLPEECKKIIKQIFIEGKTPREIAEELNISISTVNSQKMRGLSLLKAKLPSKDFLLVLSLLMSDWKN